MSEAQEAKRLRKLAADLSLDKEVLQSAIEKTDEACSDKGIC